MTPVAMGLDHILVLDRVETKRRRGSRGGSRAIRRVDRYSHGGSLARPARRLRLQRPSGLRRTWMRCCAPQALI